MDREALQAIVHGVPRVGHNLATKPPPPHSLSPLAWPLPCVFCSLLLLSAMTALAFLSVFHLMWTIDFSKLPRAILAIFSTSS